MARPPARSAELSAAQARRIALAAQGFARPRPTGRVDKRHLRQVLKHIGLIQIDSVNVLVRSQELPLFARLGAHPRDLISTATSQGELFEYWVHEASHVPIAQYPLYGWRRERPVMWKSLERLRREQPGLLEQVEAFVADNGPTLASDLGMRTGRKGAWWDWDEGKLALETLFHTGRLAARRRANDFARVYDLAERVIPADIYGAPTPDESDARSRLVEMAAEYYGVATVKDLADYHRQRGADVRPLVADLVDAGRLLPVRVEGWDEPGYLHPDAIVPRSLGARALLSPFDPVVWNRDRAQRLFDFYYRIEIYTPKPKRQYGYYVLPFLLGDRIVGRVDLKADRARSTMMVNASWIEDGYDPAVVAPEMRAEIAAMASWLGLESTEFHPVGNLAL